MKEVYRVTHSAVSSPVISLSFIFNLQQLFSQTMITYQLNEHIVYKEEGAQSNSTSPEMLQIPLATNVANYLPLELRVTIRIIISKLQVSQFY